MLDFNDPTGCTRGRRRRRARFRPKLSYANDAGPGIMRRKAGKGFFYLAPDGSRVTEAATIARINKLAIPPAWTNVWISEEEHSHIQRRAGTCAGASNTAITPAGPPAATR